MKLQKTIERPTAIRGKGLFGGKEASVIFRPAPVDTGVVFVRTDIAEPVRIRAIALNIGKI